MRIGSRGLVVVLGDAVALAALRPHTDLVPRLAHPARWVHDSGADRVVGETATAAIWLLALWVALGLGVVAASALPGAAGRAAARIATHTLPANLRRLVAGSIGLGVLLAPVAAGAGTPSGAGPARPPTDTSAPRWVGSAPTPAWPTSGTAPPPTSSPPTSTPPRGTTPTGTPKTTDRSPVPGPRWPGQGANPRHAESPRSPDHRPTDHRPTDHRPTDHRPTDHRSSTAAPGSRDVTVRSGDSLWLLAAHRLGPDADVHHVAAYWPRVYAANRDTVGPDPALITPGQVLHVPAPSPEGSA